MALDEIVLVIGAIIAGILVLGAIGAVVVAGVARRLLNGESPTEILQKRYARGELTRVQYEQMRQDLEPPTAGSRESTAPEAGGRWHGLYKLGGGAALLIALLLLGEIVVYAVWSRPGSAAEHFALFRQNWLVGLLTLDLLGMISYVLFVPTILALYVALHRTCESIMAVATALFFLGVADFFATNTAFSVLDLSQRYATATTEADRAMLLAAGQAMFTLFNENAFLVSYVMVSAAWMMIAAVMLLSAAFGRVAGWAGMLAGGAGILAVVLEHVSPAGAVFALAIALYFAAIVFLLIWVVLVGRRLYQLGLVSAADER